MAELVAAGAPELPEGWFYRVCRTSIPGYRVEIRRQKWFRSVCVSDAYVLEERYDDMTDAVVVACVRAHERIAEEAASVAKFEALAQLAGDHDPKGGRG
ncbi:hypothetical protein [Streptomyces sp. CAU 1734]|uniref:hypothetical protein n=1 Tax=Streptomyces sp. CAU 1734 TaxID=3140360 RepID=UPI003261CD33